MLWFGQLISQSGDSIYQIGLLWLVLDISGSESITGLVAMAAYLPAVVLSLTAGVSADRGDRRRIMLGSDVIRCLVVLLIPLLFFLDYLNPWFLAVNAFAIAIAATFFNPARDAIVPQLVPSTGLLRANSLIQTSWQFSLLLGPAIAGFLIHLAGNISLFTVVSGAYAISFLSIYLIRMQSQTAKPVSKGFGFAELKEGLTFVIRHKVLLPLLLITIADNIFIMGPAIVGTPVLVKNNLGHGAEAYALIQGCYAIGMLIGTAGLLWVGNKFGKGKILLTGMFFDGLTFIPIFWVQSISALAIIIVIHSLAIPLLTISRTSMIQNIVPEHLTGRVFALVNLSVVGMSAISAGITGFVVEAIGVKPLFLVIGIGGTLCGCIGWIFAKKLKIMA